MSTGSPEAERAVPAPDRPACLTSLPRRGVSDGAAPLGSATLSGTRQSAVPADAPRTARSESPPATPTNSVTRQHRQPSPSSLCPPVQVVEARMHAIREALDASPLLLARASLPSGQHAFMHGLAHARTHGPKRAMCRSQYDTALYLLSNARSIEKRAGDALLRQVGEAFRLPERPGGHRHQYQHQDRGETGPGGRCRCRWRRETSVSERSADGSAKGETCLWKFDSYTYVWRRNRCISLRSLDRGSFIDLFRFAFVDGFDFWIYGTYDIAAIDESDTASYANTAV